MKKNIWITCGIFFYSAFGTASPSSLTYQGRIVKSDGTPLQHSNVSFQFEITNPSGSCVLFREQVNGINMTGSNGIFDVKIGASHSYPSDPGFKISDSFNNNTSLSCDGGVIYSPATGDERLLRVQFYDGVSWRSITPASVIRSVPFAAYSEAANKLGSHAADEFVLKTSINSNTSCDGGSFLTWNASTQTFGCTSGSVGSGTVTNVTSANSYLTISNATTVPLLTLNVGTGANTVAAGNDSRLSNARVPTGTAGGDLSGTYPNPSVAKIQGVGLDFSTAPTTGQVLSFDGTNWIPASLPAASSGTVTGITAGTGLTGGTITASGTIGLGSALAGLNGIATNGYIQRIGAGTYSTTLGSATAPSSNNTLVLRDGSGVSSFYGLGLTGATSGGLVLKTADITNAYTLTFPNDQGGANQVLSNNGSGILSWATMPAAPGADCSVGSVLTYTSGSFSCVPDQTGAAGGGITSLAGQTGSSQAFALNTNGNAPAWNSATDVHTLSLPFARNASVTAGLISKAEYDTFNNKQVALGFTPLNPSNNLSELIATSASVRTNLGLGSAATKEVPSTGDASTTEVVLGDDTRLTNSRAPSGTAGGDLSGTYPNPDVNKIKGVSLSMTSLTTGDFLKYNGTNWINSIINISDVSGLSASLATKIDQSQISGTCSTSKTLTFSSVTGTWTCSDIAIAGTQVTYASQTAKTFLAAPTGAAGAPSFRTIASTDLPSSVTDGLWTASSGNVYRSTGNVGIGVSNPTALLQVNGDIMSSMSDAWASVTARTYSPDGDDIPMLRLQRSRGTEASPAYLQSGDILGYLLFQSYNGSAMNGWRAGIFAEATQNHGDDSFGTRLQFQTTGNGGSTAATRVTIDHNGYVGIGTSTPTLPLTIKSANYPVGITQNQVGADATMELTTADASGNQATRIMLRGNTNQNDIEFLRGGRGAETTSMYIKGATGNVGIGTSTPAALLHVAGNAQIDGDVVLPGNTAMKGSNSTSYLALYSATTGNDGSSLFLYGGDHATQPGNIYATYGGGSSGFFQLRFNNGTTTSNILRATASGNVGLGTTSPDTKLHIYATTNARIRLEDQNSNWDLWGGNDLIFQRAGVNMFKISAAGDVGIGTNSPATKLHVYDSANGATVARFQSGNGTCNVVPSSGVTCSSDRRLKKDFQPISQALEKVEQIHGVTFRWKDQAKENKKRYLGFIAQEVEKVAPELVSEDEQGFKQVNYANFVAILTEALKEFYSWWQKDSADLHAKYQNLKERTAYLEAALSKERKRNDEMVRRLEALEKALREQP